MNIFILSYNPLMVTLQPSQLLMFIKEGRRIDSWYSPYIGTYFIKSNDGIIEMSHMFSGIFNGELHTISQVFNTHMGGHMPPAVWQWLGGMTSLNSQINFANDVPPAPPR